jgi:uncharacterized protein
MGLAEEKYVVVTTFRRSGEGVSTATWVTGLPDGRIGFWTSSQSGKAKRLRNNGKVTVQPGNARGATKPGTEATAGTATVVTDGPDFDAVQSRIKAKYGFMVTVSKWGNTIGHLGKKFPYGDLAVVVTPECNTPEGNTPEGNTPEGNTPEGNTPEGNTPEGNTPEGNTPEGNTPEGNTPEGNTPEGNTPEGNTPEGNTPEGNTPEGNTPDG